MSNLSDLTMVVPTRGDCQGLVPGVAPALEQGAHLLVLNNGETPVASRIPKKLGRRVSEWHAPGMFAEQLRDAPSHITTKYAVLVDDDQFLFPTSANRAVASLNADSSIQLVSGRILVLERDHDRFRITANPKEVLWRDPFRPKTSVQGRLLDLARNWKSGIWYSIQTRDLFAHHMELVYRIRRDCSTPSATEVAVEILGRTVKGVSLGNRALQVRSLLRPSTCSATHRTSLSYHEWRQAREFEEEVGQFDELIFRECPVTHRAVIKSVLPIVADDSKPFIDRLSWKWKRAAHLLSRRFDQMRNDNPRIGPLAAHNLVKQDREYLRAWARSMTSSFS